MNPRIPFIAPHNFVWLTRIALFHASENPDNIYGALLSLLEDCRHVCNLSGFEQVGASYRTLRRVGQRAGMSKEEMREWVVLAETVPLSERHALYILEKLGERHTEAAHGVRTER